MPRMELKKAAPRVSDEEPDFEWSDHAPIAASAILLKPNANVSEGLSMQMEYMQALNVANVILIK